MLPERRADYEPPPKGLLAETREWWNGLWEDDVFRRLVTPATLPDLRYLAQKRDQRERIMRSSRGSAALAKGVKGQDVANPLLKLLPSIDKEIRLGMAAFGLTAISRARLGVAAVAAKSTLAERLDSLDDEDHFEDPRLTLLEGTG